MTLQDLAVKISRDRSKWLTKQLKKILPNHIYCLCRQPGAETFEELQNYFDKEKIRVAATALETRLYQGGRLIAYWRANVNIKEPDIIPVKHSIINPNGTVSQGESDQTRPAF